MASQKRFVFYTKGLECKSFYDEKAKKKRYFVKGHIDSGDLDLVNDIVTRSCMVDIQKQLKARSIKLDLDHETLRKGKGETDFDAKLNLTKIPLGKAINESLDEKGNFVEFELNPNWKKLDSKGDVVTTFTELWTSIKGRFYDAFSIAYVPIKTAFQSMKEGKARLLDKVNLINIGLTGNAINPNASMTSVMAKSLEWLKENEGSIMEGKGYDKDGAHAHTENEPLGIHNHTEIEKRIQSEVEYLSDRVSRLSDRVYKLESGKPESEGIPTQKGKTKSGDGKMTEEGKEKKPAEPPKDAPAEPAATPPTEPAGEGEPKDPPADPPAGDGAAEGAEEKSIDAKAFGELKSTVDTLAKSVEKINKVLEKALPAGHGAANKAAVATQNPVDTKSHATGTMDLI